MLNQSCDPINCGEVRTSASLTARTVESLDHREKYFSPYRRTITSYFNYILIADLCSDLWLDKKNFFVSCWGIKKYKGNDKRFNNCGYSLFFLMGIFLKHLWLIPNILKWQDWKILTKLVSSQTLPETATRGVLLKKVFLKICEIS